MSQPMIPGEPPKRRDWASPERQHHEFASGHSPTRNHLKVISTEQSVGSIGSGSQTVSSSLQRTRSILGLHPDAPINKEHDLAAAERDGLWWSKVSQLFDSITGSTFANHTSVTLGKIHVKGAFCGILRNLDHGHVW
jgi:hypothetical protein